jgi:hypothetical protein
MALLVKLRSLQSTIGVVIGCGLTPRQLATLFPSKSSDSNDQPFPLIVSRLIPAVARIVALPPSPGVAVQPMIRVLAVYVTEPAPVLAVSPVPIE